MVKYTIISKRGKAVENLRIAIVSRDEAYNRALSLSLLNACREFDIEVFDSEKFVKLWSEYQGKCAFYDTFDIVLWAGNEISESYGDNIVFLTDKPSLIDNDYKLNKFCIYKYSSAHTMLSSIFDIYSHLTGRASLFVRNDNVRLVGFSSCSGGTGCTTLAICVGRELVRFHGMRVLYLSMEDVESTGNMFNITTGTRNIGEFLYRLLSHNREKYNLPASIPFLDGFIVKDPYGIEAFAPSKGKNPLRELRTDEIQKLVASLVDCGRYDCVLIDFSSCLTEAGLAAMDMTERICLVAGPDQDKNRELNYLSQIICCNGDNSLDKYLKVRNMCNGIPEEGEVDCDEIIPTKTFVSLKTKEGNFFNDISRLCGRLFL